MIAQPEEASTPSNTPTQGSWFVYTADARLAIWFDELVLDLPEKDETQSSLSVGHRKTLYRPGTHLSP